MPRIPGVLEGAPEIPVVPDSHSRQAQRHRPAKWPSQGKAVEIQTGTINRL
jgi:hypothetical protein